MFVKFTFALHANIPVDVISRQFVLARATDFIALMRQRVQQRGQNLQDRAMAPYAPMTEAQRKRKGRQTALRDLTFTGRMMGDIHIMRMTQSRGAWFATVGFATGYGRLLAMKHQSIDPWFGASPKDRAAAFKIMQRSIGPEIQRHLKSPSRSGGNR